MPQKLLVLDRNAVNRKKLRVKSTRGMHVMKKAGGDIC